MTLILSGTDGLSDVDGSAATPAIRGTDANTGIFFPAADTIAFAEGGVESMRIDSSGNVGIGTSSPSSKFQVAGDVRINTVGTVTTGLPIYAKQTNNDQRGIWTESATTDSNGRFYCDNSVVGIAASYSTTGSYLPITFTTNSTERMRIDSSGRVGIANTSPSVNLEIGADTSTVRVLAVRYSSVPVYLSSSFDGTLGLSTLSSNNYNTSNGSSSWSSFSNAGYGSSAVQLAVGTGGADIRFLTAAAANTNPSERARIDSSGNLLVGTTSTVGTSAAGSVHIVGGPNNNNTGPLFLRNSFATAGKYWKVGPVNDNGYIVFNQNGTGVYISDGATSWTSNSDERNKDIIEPITNAAEKVCTLRSVIGKYKTDAEGTRRAFLIAQDVQAVLPEAVNAQNDERGTLGVAYTDIIPLLVAAIKEQQSISTQLQADVAALKGTA